jgi:hypothetical protein
MKKTSIKGEMRMKSKTITTIMTILFLASIVVMAIPAMADTDRFSGMTYFARVETQADVDALEKVIDSTTYDIGILVEGSGLTLEGFEITGSTGDGDLCIAVEGQADVTVSNCELTGGHVALYYYASSGTISHNTVTEYRKNGIIANMPSGDGGSVDIFWNTVTGRGPLEYGDYAQNGIQIGFGATGNVRGNDVSDNWYIPYDWAACGILIFESDDCMVQGNVLEDNQDGVAIETWCWDSPTASASENRVVKNEIRDGQVGVSVAAYAWTYSTGDPMADNNKVVNNIIENQVDCGVSIGAWDLSGHYTASADNNKAIRNVFSGCTEDIDDEGTATKKHANIFS